MRVSWRYKEIEGKITYAVPTQLASLDLLKSEEMEGSTEREGQPKRVLGHYWRDVLVGTKVTEMK